MQTNRHDLVDFNAQGLAMALRSLTPVSGGAAALAYMRRLIQGGADRPLPGIVRRGEPALPADAVAVGFSSPVAAQGARRRAAAVVHPSGIARQSTPYDVFKIPFTGRSPALRAALTIRRIFAGQPGIGIWGSAALDIYTNLPFTHAASDIDLVLRGVRAGEIRAVMAEIDRAAGAAGVRADVEITLRSGAGINAREFLSDGPMLLAKGLRAVELMKRETVVRELD